MTTLDLSAYDIPTFDAACFKKAGVESVILGVYSDTTAPEQMANVGQACVDAGITILGWYSLVYFGSPYGVTRDTKWAIQLAKRFGVERVWLDCEIDGKAIGFNDAVPPTPASRVKEIRECVKLVEDAGLKCGIYSGSWWWPGNTGNTTEFSRLPLWHAGYLNDGSAIKTVNYGGWTDVAIHQYTSSLNVCGRNRDANYVFMEGDEVTREEYETLMLAVFSGAEEATLPREERLKNALYRADQRAQGLASSVADQSASAITIVQEHVLNHAAGVHDTTDDTHVHGVALNHFFTGPPAAATTIGVVK